MAENVQSAMLEILKRIQSDMADVKNRLERIEDVVGKQRRDGAAMLVMMRATVGAFDERMLRVEEDIRLIKDAMG